MFLKLLFIAFLTKNALTLNNDLSLVFLYFTKIHPVTHLILITSNLDALPDLILNFTRNSVFVEHIDAKDDIETFEIFHATNIPVGVFVDKDDNSYGAKKFLEVASSEKYFNSTYFWLIQGYDTETADEALGNLFHIQINSQITFVEKIDAKYSRLIDIYSYGRHLRHELVMTVFAEWFNEMRELVITKEFPLMYRKEYRGDFKELVMRQAIVVS